jgi:flagellar biosynthetic protein FliP
MNPSQPMSTDAPNVPAAVPLRRLIALLVGVGVMISMLLALVPASAAERAASAAASGPAARAPAAAAASAPRSADSKAEVRLGSVANVSGETSAALRIVLGLTLLAVLPALIVSVTAFLRIVIVLSMLRHAIGMPETPPNTVLIGLSLFMTLFTMSPVLEEVNREAMQPFMAGTLSAEEGFSKAARPVRDFMIRQTREQDLALMIELSKAPTPASIEEVGNVQLIPAFMLSELRTAFQIGFVVFLPFVLIDLVVSSVLMALGMMMMPPITIALPLKVLIFVLIDGWSVLLTALVGSFR